jgi:hypothetical protein
MELSNTRLTCVDPKLNPVIWGTVHTHVRRAVFRTNLCAFSEIERDVLTGKALVWLALSGTCGDVTIHAVACTRLELTDAGKVCVITACQGKEMARWLPLIRGIEDYAKAEGCRCVRIFGRKGWLRVLDGYRQTYVILDKTLE